MLTIRLQRSGKANRPQFRIILAEKTAAASKKFVEILGHYNPRTKEFGIKKDRLQYWLAQHVSISPTAHNLFVTKTLVEGKKVKAFSVPKKPVVAEAQQSAAPTPETSTPAPAETAVTEAPAAEEDAVESTAKAPAEAATPAA